MFETITKRTLRRGALAGIAVAAAAVLAACSSSGGGASSNRP
jgi:hypothetical protein